MSFLPHLARGWPERMMDWPASMSIPSRMSHWLGDHSLARGRCFSPVLIHKNGEWLQLPSSSISRNPTCGLARPTGPYGDPISVPPAIFYLSLAERSADKTHTLTRESPRRISGTDQLKGTPWTLMILNLNRRSPR